MKKIIFYIQFALSYFKINVKALLEYKASTISQLVGMFVNDILWVSFWWIYFSRFPIVKGWGLNDILLLWGVITFSFGIAAGIFGNALHMATQIVQGQLDYYLTLPKNILFHLLVSKIRIVNVGDMLFGPLLVLLFVPLTWGQFLIYFLVSTLSAVVLLSVFIIFGSLAMFLGQSSTLSMQLNNAITMFSTYPTKIYGPITQIILYTVIPAAFVSSVPVEIIRSFSFSELGVLFIAAVFYFSLAVFIFKKGLKKYESGNLLLMRR